MTTRTRKLAARTRRRDVHDLSPNVRALLLWGPAGVSLTTAADDPAFKVVYRAGPKAWAELSATYRAALQAEAAATDTPPLWYGRHFFEHLLHHYRTR